MEKPKTSAGYTLRILALALAIFVFDQLTKLIVIKMLPFGDERDILHGFFRLVHWRNTGAAWSMFHGYNTILAIVAIAALTILFFTRHHFDAHRFGGQISLGLIFGGIAGNLLDRLRFGYVIDFLYFYVIRRDGQTAGFPAFNVADSAICVGVGLLFIFSWSKDKGAKPESAG